MQCATAKFTRNLTDSNEHDDVGCVAHMEWEYGSKFQIELSDLLNKERWSDVIDATAVDGLAVSNVARLDSLVVMMLCHSAAEYDIRFGCLSGRYPYRLLLLVKSRRDVSCEIRRAICTELLEHDPAQLEHSTLNISIIFAK